MSIDYTYPGGRVVSFMCRQIPGAASDISTVIKGTKAASRIGAGSSGSFIVDAAGEKVWEMAGSIADAYKQEHKARIDSIRSGTPIVELRQTAESSLTAVLGRMAASTPGSGSRGSSWPCHAHARRAALLTAVDAAVDVFGPEKDPPLDGVPDRFFGGIGIDRHLNLIGFEDGSTPRDSLLFEPDRVNSAVSSRASVHGYRLGPLLTVEKPHSYKTSQGRPELARGMKSTFSQARFGLVIARDSWGRSSRCSRPCSWRWRSPSWRASSGPPTSTPGSASVSGRCSRPWRTPI